MADIIKNNLNVDGYIANTVPTLWHANGIFHEELCLFGTFAESFYKEYLIPTINGTVITMNKMILIHFIHFIN